MQLDRKSRVLHIWYFLSFGHCIKYLQALNLDGCYPGKPPAEPPSCAKP